MVSPTPRAHIRRSARYRLAVLFSSSPTPLTTAVLNAMTASSRFATYVFFLGLMQAKFLIVYGACWYDNKKHEENSEVPTEEPCLNCTCSRSVLLCYLRVCPKLPNPPPPGCILLHRYRSCCPELICSDFYDGGNSLEARADFEGEMDMPSDDHSVFENACILNGSIYGPGSAMHSSSLCEYCYCLAGKQICVKPKCLLPIEGCSPVFHKTSCCPVSYNCTSKSATLQFTTEQPTTTTKSYKFRQEGGCIVDGTHYTEGSKVIGVGHSICDNCYCLRSILRCEPQSCAPPLLGCTPVIKTGECCAASYNCNGTLEIEPEPNYGLFPTISKEYSKLRKEVQRKPPKSTFNDNMVTVAPFYVLAETLQEPTTKLIYQRSPETYGTTRQFSGTNFKPSSTHRPLGATNIKQPNEDHYYLISSSKYRSSTTEKPMTTTLSSVTPNANTKKVFGVKLGSSSTEMPLEVKNQEDEDGDYLGFGNLNILSIVDSLLDGKIYRNVEEKVPSTTVDSNSLEIDTTVFETTATTDLPTTALLNATEEEVNTTTEESYPVTVTEILNSTDCIEQNSVLPLDPSDVNNLAEGRTEFISTTDHGTEEPSSESFSLSTEDTQEVKLRRKVQVGTKLPADIEAILNSSKHKEREDSEYDYDQPTLPPSLPNLKIIPFVAADALVLKKESLKDPTSIFDEKIAGSLLPLEYSSNIFKPPIETEGGFMPKDPSAIDKFYDNVVPVVSITSEASESIINCIKEGEDIQHGMPVPSDSPCMTCTCLYGNIACQKIDCPPPKLGCKLAVEQLASLCCPNYICDDSFKLSQIPSEIVTVAEGIIPQDPFKNVIRTKPAPDLQSLIGDKKTHYHPNRNDIKDSTTKPAYEANDGFDELVKFIFSGTPSIMEKPMSHNPVAHKNESKFANKSTNTTSPSLNLPLSTTSVFKSSTLSTNLVQSASTHPPPKQNTLNSIGVGLLKLAGCNIYGRMYRVGRIISELSGPCVECKCTEVGVQCRQLKCSNAEDGKE
ncbi:uncharacterized protein [Euwallacea fornicatus]|uniref:uncharacterized protein n=1 Tax=Euwallacea fornicatus TaxID=995702 RepID=UPI00338FAE27